VLPQSGLSDQDAPKLRDERERVAALRAERRFFWLDVSLRETSPDDLADAYQPKRSHQPSHSLAGSARTDLMR